MRIARRQVKRAVAIVNRSTVTPLHQYPEPVLARPDRLFTAPYVVNQESPFTYETVAGIVSTLFTPVTEDSTISVSGGTLLLPTPSTTIVDRTAARESRVHIPPQRGDIEAAIAEGQEHADALVRRLAAEPSVESVGLLSSSSKVGK